MDWCENTSVGVVIDQLQLTDKQVHIMMHLRSLHHLQDGDEKVVEQLLVFIARTMCDVLTPEQKQIWKALETDHKMLLHLMYTLPATRVYQDVRDQWIIKKTTDVDDYHTMSPLAKQT